MKRTGFSYEKQEEESPQPPLQGGAYNLPFIPSLARRGIIVVIYPNTFFVIKDTHERSPD